eukprot:m.299511 g.299511  ORF g.299511 m.299511 type:complete len:431 (+) comp14153_c0_seq1:164-1456(+)
MASKLRRQASISIIKSALKQGVLYHEVDQGQPCFACDSCTGFELHFWRKTCKNCNCSKSSHGIVEVREREVGRLTLVQEIEKMVQANAQRDREAREQLEKRRKKRAEMAIVHDDFTAVEERKLAELEASLAWIPAGLTAEQVKAFYETIPKSKRPVIGTEGEFFRLSQLERQLPPHDIDETRCSSLVTDEERQRFREFNLQKIEEAADIGQIVQLKKANPCFACGEVIDINQFAVCVDRISVEDVPAYYHADTCFVCEVCEEMLVDLFCFVHQGERLLCGRHWSDQHKPRCAACDETVMADDLTVAEKQHWHLNHFCCFTCDKLLADQEYIAQNGKPFCLDCFKAKHGDMCAACQQVIDPTASKISNGKKEPKYWHLECFECCECHEPLQGRACFPKNDKLYCRDDYNRIFKKVQRKSIRKRLPPTGEKR